MLYFGANINFYLSDIGHIQNTNAYFWDVQYSNYIPRRGSMFAHILGGASQLTRVVVKVYDRK